MVFVVPLTEAFDGIAPGTRILKADEVRVWQDAERVREQARQEAARIVAGAQDAVAAERARGFAEGVDEGRAENIEQMMMTAGRAVDYLEKIEGEMVDVVLSSVRRIIADYDNAALIAAVVRSALGAVRNQKQVTLRLAPAAAPQVRESLAQITAKFPGIGFVELVEDPRVEPDGCIVESDIGVVEASVECHIRAIANAFEKVFSRH